MMCVWFAGRTDDLPAIFHNVTVVIVITAHRVGGMHIKRLLLLYNVVKNVLRRYYKMMRNTIEKVRRRIDRRVTPDTHADDDDREPRGVGRDYFAANARATG